MLLRLTFVLAALSLAACGAGPEAGTPEPLAEPEQTVDAGRQLDAGHTTTTGPMTGMPCDVARVLAENCVSCHGSNTTNGAPDSLVTREDLLALSPRGGTLAARSVARMKDPQAPMPPDYFAPAVSQADQALFDAWVLGGMPGGACTTVMPEVPDAGTGSIDAGTVDAGVDAGIPDAGKPDAGSTPPMMDAGVACTTDTWANYGQAFFASTCTNCHHHSGQFTSRASVQSGRGSITSRISSGNMPEGTTLNAAAKTRILRYLSCNVP